MSTVESVYLGVCKALADRVDSFSRIDRGLRDDTDCAIDIGFSCFYFSTIHCIVNLSVD